MPEQEKMDDLLRGVLSANPQPELSSTFDRKLTQRLQPRRRLNSFGRQIMVLYAVLALAFSIWFMRREAVTWIYVGVSILVPLMVMALTLIRSGERLRD